MIFSKDEAFIDFLTHSDVTRYMQFFLPDVKIKAFAILPEGYENIPIHVRTMSESYVLRISLIKKDHRMYSHSERLLQREHDFMCYVRKHGVAVPLLYRDAEQQQTYVKVEKGSYVLFITLMAFIEGDHPAYNADNLEEIAAMQGKLHRVSAGYVPAYVESDGEYSAMSHRMVAPSSWRTARFPAILHRKMADIYPKIRDELQTYYRKQNKQIIHSDMKCDNLFFRNRRFAAFIDFGDIRWSVIAEDVGTFIWDMCDKLFEQGIALEPMVKRYLEAYQRNNRFFTHEDGRMAIAYAIDRYLIINLHYLVENQGDEEKLKYQVDKARKQLEIVEALLVLQGEV